MKSLPASWINALTFFTFVEHTATTDMVKYYYAGSQRLAMRKGWSPNANLTWLVGDHLGSTSVTAAYDGSNPVTQLYKPWGEVRYSSAALPTDYTYTGQYSHTDDFGLMYYVARWYDPVLGRFAQADTLVPATGEGGNPNAVGYIGRENYLPLVVDYHENQFLTQHNEEMKNSLLNPDWKLPPIPTNPVAFDRYAYSLNNPVKYIDPTGHIAFIAALAAITPVGWVAIGVATVAVVAYFAVPGVQEAVTTATAQALNATSDAIATIAQIDLLPRTGPFPYLPAKQKGNPDVVTVKGGGFLDKFGNIWRRDKSQHGGPHWDVEHPDGSHTNVDDEGNITH